MTPKRQYIENFRNDEASYGEASVEFAKAYVHLQCALTSAEAFYDIMHRHHVDMGEVKQDYNRCFNYMDRLAKTISKHLGVDTKAMLGKVYDDAQQEIDRELNSDNGHYVDDPLLITSVVPEFQNIGDLKPIHNEERTNTSYQ